MKTLSQEIREAKNYETTVKDIHKETLRAGAKVDKLARSLVATGAAKDYENALTIVEAEHPNLWKMYCGESSPDQRAALRKAYSTDV